MTPNLKEAVEGSDSRLPFYEFNPEAINTLVNDIIMPLIATFTGKVDFSELTLTIGQSSIKYGEFILLFTSVCNV